MTRPLRSLLLGDCDHYLSPYIFGVQQAMARLGHWHSQVSIRAPLDVIAKRIEDVRPDVLWTHMLLWPPPGAPHVDKIVGLMERAARQGARVVIHDGDYKQPTRHPQPLPWCALALLNHGFSRAEWKCPTLRWPYFAFAQDRIADAAPTPRRLFFAGKLSSDRTYADRTAFLRRLEKQCGLFVHDPDRLGNSLYRTAEIAASEDAVIGFGRPGSTGWVDTRVFQWSGAGAILLHDDAARFLEPWAHFIPYKSGDVGSVVEALARLRAMPESERRHIRESAFAFVQQRHSSVARVRQVLATIGLDEQRRVAA